MGLPGALLSGGAVLAFYLIYKYPNWLLGADGDLRTFHLAGKSPGFWYVTLYTGIVCGASAWVLISGKNRYQRSKKKGPLSPYQSNRFLWARSPPVSVVAVASMFAPSMRSYLRRSRSRSRPDRASK